MADDGVTEITERNKRGELWVRGQNVMKGYWRNSKATKETKTEDGWLRTGDVTYVDDDGKFHVVDRMKVRRNERHDHLAQFLFAGLIQTDADHSHTCRN